MIYESDPDRAPDTDFVPGELGLLVPGNRGRLLDARRTPVTVVAVRPEVGAFVVEIGAFEDAGARWELPLEEFGRFQFARDAARADAAELERALARFDRIEEIAVRPGGARGDAAARRGRARRRPRVAPATACRRSASTPRSRAARASRRCTRCSTSAWAASPPWTARSPRRSSSNPRSGELVKGHAIVLAELGLCPYRGKAVRDPSTFDGERSRARRAEHLVARLALHPGAVVAARAREPSRSTAPPRSRGRCRSRAPPR